jgi:methylmalonyl-CoA mutase N-terminal domain/subunit
LRTQQIIAHETGVPNVTDPLGGSHYVEWLTTELERKAREEMGRIEAMGGAIAAVEEGYYQKEIQEAAYRYQKAVDSGEEVLVGVNRYEKSVVGALGQQAGEIFSVDQEAVREEQTNRLDELKASRDAKAVESNLSGLRRAAEGTSENLMPPIISAVRAYATLGEICDVLREVWGEFDDSAVAF